MTSMVFFNDALCPESEIAIHPADPGYAFGEGVFETIRSYQGRPFKLQEHLLRLRLGLKQLEIPEPSCLAESAAIIKRLLMANQLLTTEAVIRITVSRGSTACPQNSFPVFLISADRLNLKEMRRRKQGLKAEFAAWRRDAKNPLLKIKSLNYLENRLALRQAQKLGFDEAIFLNQEGALCEGSFSNLFIIADNHLYTPPLPAGILAGITRNFILQNAAQVDLTASEKALFPSDLKKAAGALLTSSLMETAPLLQLGHQHFDSKKISAITKALDQLFRQATQ